MNTKSKKESLGHGIYDLLNEYVNNEEAFQDDTQLEINVNSLTVDLVDADVDRPDCDYYQVLDLLKGSNEQPGLWVPDMEAIQEICKDYLEE